MTAKLEKLSIEIVGKNKEEIAEILRKISTEIDLGFENGNTKKSDTYHCYYKYQKEIIML